MAYIQIYVQAPRHHKILPLSDAAFRLWVVGLCYCQEHLTDGAIPAVVLPTFGVKRAGQVAKELQDTGLWRATATGFQVHDYTDWNAPRAVVTKRRQRANERYRRWQDKHATNAVSNTVGNAVINAVPNGAATQRNATQYVQDPPLAPHPASGDTWRDEWFAKAYGAYPNKAGKNPAYAVWVRDIASADEARAVVQDIQRRVASGWVRLERRFIPKLARYLEERHWEDAHDEALVDPLPAFYKHVWACPTCGDMHDGTAEQYESRACLREVAHQER